jgi:hypothetical protein
MFLAMVGGVTQTLLIVFNWIVAPFAKFGFQMRAYKRLYWARTSDDRLFVAKPDDKTRFKRDFEECTLAQNPYEEEFQSNNMDPIELDILQQEDYEGGRRSQLSKMNNNYRPAKYDMDDVTIEPTGE